MMKIMNFLHDLKDDPDELINLAGNSKYVKPPYRK